jgi:AraC family transcriptional regulator
MPKMQPLTIDFTQEDEVLQILPRPSLRSSANLGWNGVYVQQHRQPAWEVPECAYMQHTIVIHTSEDMAQVERRLDGQRQHEQVGCGNMSIAPANVLHQVCWDRDADFILLSLEPTYLAQIAHELIDPDRAELIPHFTQFDPLIYQIGLSLQAELKSSGLGDRLFVDSLATALGIHLLRNYALSPQSIRNYPDGLPKYRLQLAIDYIDTHLGEELSLDAIASAVGMSQSYFCRLFKQSIGLAPYQYVIQQRVGRAKLLLKQPARSISDIALECGFASQGHLNLHFKRLVGVTPREFRHK